LTVTARSIWRGSLVVQKHEIAVKLYAAVEDRRVHFHLLHKRDHARVEQRMVDPETGTAVSLEETRRAFEVGQGLYVVVDREDIERSEPEPAEEIRVSRFVPIAAVDPKLFDRPYYLGPDSDSAGDYFALVHALNNKQRAGIATWVMRRHSYVGALLSYRGYLMLCTLRHADEVISVRELEPPQGATLERKEHDLAGKLIEALSGRFDPNAYRDEYQERVHELIEAKRAGKKVKRPRIRRPRAQGSLADALQSSLKQASGRKRT
jgi:DNA end-binding protein Ku